MSQTHIFMHNINYMCITFLFYKIKIIYAKFLAKIELLTGVAKLIYLVLIKDAVH
jgi:hypothetical protein